MPLALSTALLTAQSAAPFSQLRGVAFAVLVACAVTALVAIGMVIVAQVRRVSRRVRGIAVLSAAVTMSLLALSIGAGVVVNANASHSDATGDASYTPSVIHPVAPPVEPVAQQQLETLLLD